MILGLHHPKIKKKKKIDNEIISLVDYIHIRQHYRNIKSIKMIGQLDSFLLKSEYVYLNQTSVLCENL